MVEEGQRVRVKVSGIFNNKTGWIDDPDYSEDEFLINTKSGVRPKYMRLDRFDVSNTITTEDFNPREKLHPTKNRGLSFREGARIQSFPDDFVFEGSFNNISNQIGNAVPPLLAFKLAVHIKNL